MPEKQILLRGAAAVLPTGVTEKINILILNGQISDIFDNSPAVDINPEQIINLDGLRLFAGFIDIHNHGAVGIDVNAADVDDLREVGKFLASKGVTAWLPTFVPDSAEHYQKAIKAIDDLMKMQAGWPIAQI